MMSQHAGKEEEDDRLRRRDSEVIFLECLIEDEIADGVGRCSRPAFGHDENLHICLADS